MDKVMNNSSETKAIRQRMQEVRRDLDEDVQEIVEGARDMAKWRFYVRSYPWVCVGAAVALGYWVVPRRPMGTQPDPRTAGDVAKQSNLLMPPRGHASGMLRTIVGNLVMRGVAAYVSHQADKLFASQAVQSQEDINHEEPHS